MAENSYLVLLGRTTDASYLVCRIIWLRVCQKRLPSTLTHTKIYWIRLSVLALKTSFLLMVNSARLRKQKKNSFSFLLLDAEITLEPYEKNKIFPLYTLENSARVKEEKWWEKNLITSHVLAEFSMCVPKILFPKLKTLIGYTYMASHSPLFS